MNTKSIEVPRQSIPERAVKKGLEWIRANSGDQADTRQTPVSLR